jgi:hypothetical protein
MLGIGRTVLLQLPAIAGISLFFFPNVIQNCHRQWRDETEPIPRITRNTNAPNGYADGNGRNGFRKKRYRNHGKNHTSGAVPGKTMYWFPIDNHTGEPEIVAVSRDFTKKKALDI